MYSDIGLKHDIVQLGTAADGIGLYRFQYNWSDQVYVGVIAQEVMAVRPDAVTRGSDGYLLVDYKRLTATVKASRYDAGLVVITALTGILWDLDKAVLLGIALSVE